MDLRTFDLNGMLRCGLELRRSAQDATTMEDAASAIVRYLYDTFTNVDGRPQCRLVRFYKTHRFGSLSPDLQEFARALLPSETRPTADMRCLTLLGTAGTEPAWNSRHESRGHRAIPLPSEDFVERAPMIAQLIRSFGISIPDVIQPQRDGITIQEGRSYNVFYVQQARGSPFIPAQDEFVVPYGVESVIGFGGRVEEDLYAVVIFSGERVPESAASRFRTVALDVKTSIFKFREDAVFGS